MEECLGIEDPKCGLAAVQRVATNRQMLVDYDVASKSQKLILDQSEVDLLELVDVARVEGSGIHDVAELGCLACGKCIVFEDDDADYYVDGQLMSSPF